MPDHHQLIACHDPCPCWLQVLEHRSCQPVCNHGNDRGSELSEAGKDKVSVRQNRCTSIHELRNDLSLIGFIVFTIFNVDNFIIGAVKGSSELGYYMIAFNWGSIICVILGTVVNNVLFPTFSRMEQDRERIKKSYLRVLEYVSCIGMLTNITLLLVSEDFLVYVLGHGTDKWLPALLSLRILCLYGSYILLNLWQMFSWHLT